MKKAVVRIGDISIGHTDVKGRQVIGTIVSGSDNVLNKDIGIASSSSFVFFPSHPHSTDSKGNPTDYQTHTVNIISSGKNKINNKNIAVSGDACEFPCTDSLVQATSVDLYCETL